MSYKNNEGYPDPTASKSSLGSRPNARAYI